MNCKKGDLAFIARSNFKENVGAVVEIIEPDVQRTFELGSFVWRVKTSGRPLSGFNLNTKSNREGVVTGIAFDHQLRPITGWTPEPGVVDEVFSPEPLFGEKGYPFRAVLPADFDPMAVAFGIRKPNQRTEVSA
ncbi:hypothetical protein IAG25_35520 [Caballeronia sp. EK]|uniref:hypothetical protein n=1 Tax=Caballeronia sp. EK TaxID=2767469 RepID=UPI001654D288|nr:hypothetical protein [Caballeronia sp. EK]MBC8642117.1 hypothetical protein [Caballeronia sp. EK]